MSKLISFIIPSRNLENVRGFLENIENTVFDPSCIEVLLKFDDDHEGAKEFIEAEKKKRPFDIQYILTPRLEGIFSVWIAVEQLFFMTSPETYFIQILSDEPRFTTPHWDKKLLGYIHFFKDDIFRLRLSSMKFCNYTSHYECTFRPDSFAIYTRRWLELTEGSGDCWGSDAYQQCVAFQLSMGPGGYFNFYREGGLWRDVVVYDIEMHGLEFGVGVSEQEKRVRQKLNLKEWRRLTTHNMQEHMSYLARRLYCYVWAFENDIQKFQLKKNVLRKTVSIVNEANENLVEVSYAVPRIVVYAQNIIRNAYLSIRMFIGKYLRFSKPYLIRIIDYIKKIILFMRIILKRKISKVNNKEKMFLKKKISFNEHVKEFLNKIKVKIFIPWNLLTSVIGSFVKAYPPGISFLYSKKQHLNLNIKRPTTEQSTWTVQQLKERENHMTILREKQFIINKENV